MPYHNTNNAAKHHGNARDTNHFVIGSMLPTQSGDDNKPLTSMEKRFPKNVKISTNHAGISGLHAMLLKINAMILHLIDQNVPQW